MKKYGLYLLLIIVGILIGIIYIQHSSITTLLQKAKIQEGSLYLETLQTQRYVATLLITAILGMAFLLLGYTWLINEKLVERKIEEAISKLEKKYGNTEEKIKADMENVYFNLGRTHGLLGTIGDRSIVKVLFADLAIYFFNMGSYDGKKTEIVLHQLPRALREMKEQKERLTPEQKSQLIERLDKLNVRHKAKIEKIKEALKEVGEKSSEK